MTAGTYQISLCARIDGARAHRVEVPFLGILVARRTQFDNVGCAQQVLEIGRMRIMAVGAVFEGRRMLHRAGETGTVVATEALIHALFLLESLAETDMRSVAADAAEFFYR